MCQAGQEGKGGKFPYDEEDLFLFSPATGDRRFGKRGGREGEEATMIWLFNSHNSGGGNRRNYQTKEGSRSQSHHFSFYFGYTRDGKAGRGERKKGKYHDHFVFFTGRERGQQECPRMHVEKGGGGKGKKGGSIFFREISGLIMPWRRRKE